MVCVYTCGRRFKFNVTSFLLKQVDIQHATLKAPLSGKWNIPECINMSLQHWGKKNVGQVKQGTNVISKTNNCAPFKMAAVGNLNGL